MPYLCADFRYDFRCGDHRTEKKLKEEEKEKNLKIFSNSYRQTEPYQPTLFTTKMSMIKSDSDPFLLADQPSKLNRLDRQRFRSSAYV